MTDIIENPFDWNDNLSKEALEDFEGIREDLPYCTCQNIGMALAKLELLEKQGCKVIDPSVSGSENPNKWIPLKTRSMTDEESTFYRDWAEYGAELFDCPLPDDGQEVLVSWGGTVCIDTFVRDDRDGCYFEGVDIGDVEAWMPLPEPYKAEGSEKE